MYLFSAIMQGEVKKKGVGKEEDCESRVSFHFFIFFIFYHLICEMLIISSRFTTNKCNVIGVEIFFNFFKVSKQLDLISRL